VSRGILCQCARRGHVRRNGEPACPRYAMNQAIGGQCSSCAGGWHEPCELLTLADGAIAGECRRCRWHSSEHGLAKAVAS
jgi:hypothetical protein